MTPWRAVCDRTLRFTEILSEWPGSVHDAKLFRNLPLYKASEMLFDGDILIFADAAYSPHILISFIDTI